MAELIVKCEGKIQSFLDVGTGTGLLSIIASHCGAQRIDALDISGDSIKAAKNNFQRNAVKGYNIRRKDSADYVSKVSYDLVAANLITHDLILSRQKILTLVKRSGYLALSGISNDNWPRLRKAYCSLPLRTVKIIHLTKWTSALFQRT